LYRPSSWNAHTMATFDIERQEFEDTDTAINGVFDFYNMSSVDADRTKSSSLLFTMLRHISSLSPLQLKRTMWRKAYARIMVLPEILRGVMEELGGMETRLVRLYAVNCAHTAICTQMSCHSTLTSGI
jgi:hypothetical protein